VGWYVFVFGIVCVCVCVCVCKSGEDRICSVMFDIEYGVDHD
jgi:hypothetical protein